MNIPSGEYDIQSLCEYIIDNRESVLSEYHVKQVKVYFYLCEEGWEETFEGRFESSDYGEVERLEKGYRNRRGEQNTAIFYATEYDDGIISVVTAETEDAITQSIAPTIGGSDKMSRVPITASDFQCMNEVMLDRYEDAHITNFKSERIPNLADANIRPSFSRTIEYKGDDGKYALEEFREQYGVVPVRIQYEHESFILRIDTTGKFTLRQIDRDSFGVLFDLVDEVISNILEIQDISREIEFRHEEVESGNLSISVPKVKAGQIEFSREFNKVLAENFIESTDTTSQASFSFTDVTLEVGSLDFSARVADENRGSFFNISANEDTMTLIPKKNCSFPSIVEFYMQILQSVDGGADIHLHESEFAS